MCVSLYRRREFANRKSSYLYLTKVKLPNDMPDDMLHDAIETSRRVLSSSTDFETQGM